jgi:hypothetical protein
MAVLEYSYRTAAETVESNPWCKLVVAANTPNKLVVEVAVVASSPNKLVAAVVVVALAAVERNPRKGVLAVQAAQPEGLAGLVAVRAESDALALLESGRSGIRVTQENQGIHQCTEGRLRRVSSASQASQAMTVSLPHCPEHSTGYFHSRVAVTDFPLTKFLE